LGQLRADPGPDGLVAKTISLKFAMASSDERIDRFALKLDHFAHHPSEHSSWELRGSLQLVDEVIELRHAKGILPVHIEKGKDSARIRAEHSGLSSFLGISSPFTISSYLPDHLLARRAEYRGMPRTVSSRSLFISLGSVAIALSVVAGVPASAQSTTPPTQPPATTAPQLLVSPPQLVQAQKSGTNEIKVSWLPPQQSSQPVTQYRIQIQSNSADALPNPSLITVNANTTSITVRNLKLDRSYFFTVQAQTANTLSAPSAPSNVIDLPDPAKVRPNPPTNLGAALVSADQALVTWLPPVAKTDVVIKGFRITTAPSTKRTDVGLLSQTIIGGLKPGTTYVIFVQSISSTNALSDIATSPVITTAPAVTAPPVTAPPTIATTTSTTTTTLLPLPSPVEVPALKAASKCTSRAWNPTLLGVPRQLAAGATPGVYIWTDGRTIHMRTYNNGTTPIRFSGSVSGQTTLPAVGFYLEKDLDSLSIGRTTTSFSFLSAYDLDAVRFDGRCITKATFRLSLNGQPIPPSQIFIGGDGMHPTTSSFVLSR
jgi:Fibronectin type III domain